MGCPFTAAEEEGSSGVVQDVLDRCSIDKQRSLAVNKDGANHMTPEMAARLDGIVQEAIEGTGLTFGGDRAVTKR
ncbi:hypothetical protein PR202_gb03006 [Eleusine coracana subsp. coracana]|uniref:Uncharacterized protein n=1 Tax=Eleusine coracana subsp. coracana TaxID=191504 RepID=A0AAV5E0N8_ELECO|nr:hypothetical protein PR202_gb03006 [Eleusine coracana subsp. coracana]